MRSYFIKEERVGSKEKGREGGKALPTRNDQDLLSRKTFVHFVQSARKASTLHFVKTLSCKATKHCKVISVLKLTLVAPQSRSTMLELSTLIGWNSFYVSELLSVVNWT